MSLQPGDIVTQLVRKDKSSYKRIIYQRLVRVLKLNPNYKAVVIECDPAGNAIPGKRVVCVPQRNLAPRSLCDQKKP
jgi:hypothetical protein